MYTLVAFVFARGVCSSVHIMQHKRMYMAIRLAHRHVCVQTYAHARVHVSVHGAMQCKYVADTPRRHTLYTIYARAGGIGDVGGFNAVFFVKQLFPALLPPALRQRWCAHARAERGATWRRARTRGSRTDARWAGEA